MTLPAREGYLTLPPATTPEGFRTFCASYCHPPGDSKTFIAILTYLGVGLVAGLVAGLLGVGGGIIMVPLLLVVFQRLGYTNLDLVFHVATATSLAVIVPTSMMSTWTHARNGYVRWRQVLAMTPGGLLAVHLASVVAMESAGATMITAFGILLIVASIQMIFLTPKPRETLPAIPSWAVYLLIGILSGGISYFFGIGGGIAAVPLLVLLAGSSIHQAVGTSSCLIVFLALYGTVRNATLGEGFAELPGFSLGFINLLAVACMMPASILCARVGANLAHRARGTLLRRLFGALLALEGIRLAVG